MPTFDEGHQRFAFDQQWLVEKYDAHRDYRDKIAKLSGSKAVDFIGLHGGSDGVLYWIEVKDFRGYRVANKHRLSDGELTTEVAEKVRDSIAGVVGAFCTSSQWETWHPFVRAIWQKKCMIRVLLWLEEDLMPSPPGRRANAAQVLTRELQRKLRWLTTKVFVANCHGGCPGGLEVTDLPGARQP